MKLSPGSSSSSFTAAAPAAGCKYRRAAALGCIVLLLSLNGAQPLRKARPHTAERSKAWFDARSICIFPLGSAAAPNSRDELTRAMTASWRRTLTLPDDERVVAIEGGRYPAVQAVRINLSQGEMHPERDRVPAHPTGRTESLLGVGRLEMRGESMACGKARLSFNMNVSDARFDMQRDKEGQMILMMTDARDGEMTLELTAADAQRLLLESARQAAGPFGITVRQARLKIATEAGRTLLVNLHISTLVGFIPAGMDFQARVDIDDSMNARVSGLSVEGDEALGPLISGLLRPHLSPYEGKTRLLVSFASKQLQLHDIHIDAGETLRVKACFGDPE